MTELPIPPSAIGAAARAMFPRYDGGNDDWKASYRENVAEGLRAAFDELGMRSYRIDSDRAEVLERVDIEQRPAYRLVSRWMPVKDDPVEKA